MKLTDFLNELKKIGADNDTPNYQQRNDEEKGVKKERKHIADINDKDQYSSVKKVKKNRKKA